MPRVLHVLSQRPSLTGSGITLDAIVRHAVDAGWDQDVVVGVPAADPSPRVGGLPPDRIHPLRFGQGQIEFPVPGMSDVMPYESTRFSSMSERRIASYRAAWRHHLGSVIDRRPPDLIQSHHLWIVSSLLKELAPEIPVVAHCHATGFRQMELAPHLAPAVRQGCATIDRFLVLHGGHRDRLIRELGVPADRVHLVAAGYRDDLFHARGRAPASPGRLLYVGKLAAAKGLPQLLDAFEHLGRRHPELRMDIVGGGSGEESDALRRRISAARPAVAMHGPLPQPQLADLMRRSRSCVLPSFYEGLPLVLVEALACGCRLVATGLPGVVEQLAPYLGGAMDLVPLPRIVDADRPHPDDLPLFVMDLERAIERSIARPPLGDPRTTMPGALDGFTWAAVFGRVESVWRDLL